MGRWAPHSAGQGGPPEEWTRGKEGAGTSSGTPRGRAPVIDETGHDQHQELKSHQASSPPGRHRRHLATARISKIRVFFLFLSAINANMVQKMKPQISHFWQGTILNLNLNANLPNLLTSVHILSAKHKKEMLVPL